MKILVTATSFKEGSPGPAMERLRSFADSLVFNPHERPLTEDELIPLLADCEGCVAGLDRFTRRVLENAPALRVISRYGAGVDRVDLAASEERGVAVCNTPGANAQAVADLTLGLLLAAARKIPFLDKETREGRWPRSTGIELYGKTLGILGLGAVGRAVAKRGAGFSMRILAYDPFMDEAYAGANGISPAPFERVIAEADFLCLHLPLTPETRHIISAAVMETMRPRAVIVNTARGGLIDEAAAVPFLRSGRLGGMALDVYETEPPEASPLFGLDTVVLTPHTASHTVEATAAMADMAVDNLINVLSSGHCPHMVTFTG